jgi:hypothetical protein
VILEWIETLLTPAAPAFRRLGAVDELVAVRARARRQDRAWADHREKSKAAILRVADGLERRDLAVVLGSGWLLEVPLESLARRFKRVLLVDLVVPRAVRAEANRLGSVEWRSWDVTGVYAPLAVHPKAVPAVPDPAPLPPEATMADLVVSCNLLSQLPVAPGLWMERQGIPDDPRNAVSEALIHAHLAALAACAGTVCLLTDFEREERDSAREGGATRYDLLQGARPVVDGPRWWWTLAPEGEEGRTLTARHRVMGGVLKKTSDMDDA